MPSATSAVDLDEYSLVYVATYGKAGAELDAALAPFQRDRVWFERTQGVVNQLAATDTKVAAEVNARVTILNSIAAHNWKRPELPPPGAARHIRASQCKSCGGHKRTAPRTAFVYCDYCASLFDYDEDVARARVGESSLSILSVLADGVRAEMTRAREANDAEAYRLAWRWPYEMDLLLIPENWSPRVREPAYREAIIDFCTGTTMVFNLYDRSRGPIRERLVDATDLVRARPTEKSLTNYLAIVYDLLVAEARLLNNAGLFAKHPDHLSPELYCRINLIVRVVEWKPILSQSDFELLLRISKVPIEKVTLDAVEIRQATCGYCMGRLAIVDGAKTVVCEGCGHALECARAFPCASCGAHLLAAPSTHHANCAWCSTVVTIV